MKVRMLSSQRRYYVICFQKRRYNHLQEGLHATDCRLRKGKKSATNTLASYALLSACKSIEEKLVSLLVATDPGGMYEKVWRQSL